MHFSNDLNFFSFTIQPNHIYDFYMKHLSGVQYKIVSAICRKTYGWVNEKGNRKTEDAISISQFEEITGCSRSTINEALQFLTHHKIIIKRIEGEVGNQIGVYGLAPFTEDDYKRLSKVFNKDKSNASNNIYPQYENRIPPPSTKIGYTKETKEINKKESISPPLSFSVDRSNPAVVKAPAQRTLPPDPVAKKVATAPKPSQSDACSKNAPPAGDANSVADAPSDDMIFFKEKFKKKHNITMLNEVAFEKAFEKMKKVPKIDNPVLYILPIYEQFLKESENNISCNLIKKRKEFALKRESGPKAPGGVWFVDKDSLCFQSSSEFARYAFDKNLEFWDQHGLGLAFKKTPL